MVYNSYYQPMYYQPVGGYYDTFTPGGYVPFQPSRVRGIAYTINEYFFRGLVYIQSILDVLLSTSPFFEQYGPLLKELPKMYHLVKAISEAGEREGEPIEIERLDVEFDGPAPRLFI